MFICVTVLLVKHMGTKINRPETRVSLESCYWDHIRWSNWSHWRILRQSTILLARVANSLYPQCLPCLFSSSVAPGPALWPHPSLHCGLHSMQCHSFHLPFWLLLYTISYTDVQSLVAANYSTGCSLSDIILIRKHTLPINPFRNHKISYRLCVFRLVYIIVSQF